MSEAFRTIAIIAPGLLGASLGQAIARERLAEKTFVWARRPEVRSACEATDWCTATFAQAEDAVREADLVVLCTPVGKIVPILESIVPSLLPGAIVTDVGSTKSLICRKAQVLMPPGCHFVGSHPMAGSERTGMENAQADLFEGRPCFVTPLPETDTVAAERIVRFWQTLEMKVTTASPEHHDEIVAAISHLPHLAATGICLALSKGDSSWMHLAGNGLRDTTRIAAGSPSLWREICEQNRDEILRAFSVFEEALQNLRSALENNDLAQLEHLLDLGKRYRQSMGDPGSS